jgi:hypothetical protein
LTKEAFAPPVRYLCREGFQVAPISLSEKPSAYDSKIDIILIWSDGAANVEALRQYCTIVKRSKTPLKDDQNPDMAPVIIFTENGAYVKDASEFSDALFMERSFDLRKLDQTITEILVGTSAGAVPGAHGRPDIAQPEESVHTGAL